MLEKVAASETGLCVNAKKPKTMEYNQGKDITFTAKDVFKHEQVHYYQYLGTWVDNHQNQEESSSEWMHQTRQNMEVNTTQINQYKSMQITCEAHTTVFVKHGHSLNYCRNMQMDIAQDCSA